jgi:hypothetical protein
MKYDYFFVIWMWGAILEFSLDDIPKVVGEFIMSKTKCKVFG